MKTKMPIVEAIATAERLERHADEHPTQHISMAEYALLSILEELRAARAELEAAAGDRAADDAAEARITEYLSRQCPDWTTTPEALEKAEALERHMREFPALVYGDVERCFVTLLQGYRRLQRENRVYRLYLFTLPAIPAPAAGPAAKLEESGKQEAGR